MATPTAVFPAAVATDAQLKVANNLIATALKVSATATDTILFVNSIAGFLPNSLASIDKEIVAIASIAAGSNPSLVVAPGGRGFDGTSAAQHSANAQVSMLIDAWHHNAVAAEVKAIETFLGPNGTNLPALAAGDLQASSYNFAPQSPGGSLVVGINVITLAPVPPGVNGTDNAHCLLISGGTGTAEAVTISGGTAVSGAASGTIFVTCANTHSGAWTIASATSGIQEAVQLTQTAGGGNVAAGGAAPVVVNCNISITGNYITLKLSGAGLTLAGGASIVMSGTYNSLIGTGNTPIRVTSPAADHIRLTGCFHCEIFGVYLDHSGTGATAGAGIHVASGTNTELVVQSVSMYYCYRGIWFEVSAVLSRWSDILVERAVNNGIELDSANDEHFTNLEVVYSGGHGVQMGAGPATNYWPGATRIVNSVIYANAGDGIHIEGSTGTPCTFIFITNTHVDTDTNYEMSVQNAGGISIANTQFVNGKGVHIGAGASGIQLTGVRINGSAVDGLYITGGARNILCAGLVVGDSSLGGGSTYAGIHIDGGVSNVLMAGVQIGQPDTPSDFGVQITAAGGNPTAIHINDLQFIAAANMTTPVSVAPGLTDIFVDAGNTWQPLTLSGGWTSTLAPQCRLEANGRVVRLTGLISAGTTADGTAILTLPAGYRPAALTSQLGVMLSGGGSPTGGASLQIAPTGIISLYGFGSNALLRLDSITFSLN